MPLTPHDITPPSMTRVALHGLCPKCGTRGLFGGMVAFAPKCEACGLDFTSFNVGDGAAAFLIFIIAILVFIGIMVVEVYIAPPWWVHVLLWVPLTFGLTIWLLRISKAALVAAEYRNAAREGKLSE